MNAHVYDGEVTKLSLHDARPLSPRQWRHNGRDGVSNCRPLHCLLNHLFRRRSNKRHQSSASLAFCAGNSPMTVNYPHKGPVTRKMFPFDDVIVQTNTFTTQGNSIQTWDQEQLPCLDNLGSWNRSVLYQKHLLSVWHKHRAHWSLCMPVINMVTSLNGNIFRVTGSLWELRTGHRWIPPTKASDAELWYFLWSALEQTTEQTIEAPVIWDADELNVTSLWWILSNCQYAGN